MKSIFFILNNVSTVAGLAPCSVVATQTASNNESEIDENTKKMISVANQIIKENNVLFSSITNKFNQKDTSAKKIIESITEKEKDELCNVLINKYEEANLIDKETINKIKSNKESFKQNLFKQIRKKIIEDSKVNKKENQELKKEFKSYYERIVTDAKNKYAVNNDGTENSKRILEEIENYKKILNIIENEFTPLANRINNLRIASMVFRSAAIATGIIAAASYVCAIFSFGISSSIGLVASIASATCGIICDILDSIINRFEKEQKIISKLIEYYKETKNKSGFWVAKKTIDSYLLLNFESFKTETKIGWKIAKLTFKSNKINAALSVAGVGEDIASLQNDIVEYVKFQERMRDFTKTTEQIAEKILQMKKIKWIVINETPMDKPYWQGGTGGKNLHFQNIETGTIKSLEEMLEYSNFELSFWNLMKVNSKKHGWYIKTYPNNVKFDNLG